MPAIIGKKLGMTQVFTEDGSSVPVTVIEAGPCRVTALRTADRDGYDAVQLCFGAVDEKKLTKPEAGHLKRSGDWFGRTLVEFRDEKWEAPASGDSESEEAESADAATEGSDAGPLKVGDHVYASAFSPGDKVKVAGISIGKGFQGTIKRHNFSRGPVSHGSHNVRAPGSVGASADPARVFKGIKGPGQMGNKRITQRGLEIVEVDEQQNLLLVKGAIPGPKNATVEVRSDG
jgi:large subunit ribosomal protein L3